MTHQGADTAIALGHRKFLQRRALKRIGDFAAVAAAVILASFLIDLREPRIGGKGVGGLETCAIVWHEFQLFEIDVIERTDLHRSMDFVNVPARRTHIDADSRPWQVPLPQHRGTTSRAEFVFHILIGELIGFQNAISLFDNKMVGLRKGPEVAILRAASISEGDE